MKRVMLVAAILSSCVSARDPSLLKPVEPLKVEPLNCRPVELIVDDGMWSGQIDIDNMNIAKRRCRFHYPDSPCLVVFRVIGIRNYQATCGAATKE